MSPAQVNKINFLLPIAGAVASMALTAGIAYGMIGGDVERNTVDIVTLNAQGGMLVEVRIAQGVATAERQAQAQSLDRMAFALESLSREVAAIPK